MPNGDGLHWDQPKPKRRRIYAIRLVRLAELRVGDVYRLIEIAGDEWKEVVSVGVADHSVAPDGTAMHHVTSLPQVEPQRPWDYKPPSQGYRFEQLVHPKSYCLVEVLVPVKEGKR